jgi:predicted transcriptional regulator
MGEQIIPLVVAKLIESDNFFALQLYERLQQKPNLLIEINIKDDLILEGEQGRAYKTVKKYFSSK